MICDMRRYRIRVLISLLIIIPVGFYTKFHTGLFQQWINNSSGGLFYEIFWILLTALLLPRVRVWKIVLTVFITTCIFEFLQLWHPAFLVLARNTFLGRTILGNCFTWSDFSYYFFGSLIGWFWIVKIKKVGIKK